MRKFTPLTDEEIELKRQMFQEGEALFKILDAIDTRSKKSGHEMIKLTIQIKDKIGETGTTYDYLMMYDETKNITERTIAFAHWKIKSLCKAIGREKSYDEGHLDAAMFVGKTGKCILKMQKDKSGQYPDKIGIHEYLYPDDAPQLETGKGIPVDNKKEDDAFDDDIPF